MLASELAALLLKTPQAEVYAYGICGNNGQAAPVLRVLHLEDGDLMLEVSDMISCYGKEE
jgi:hypothetical protein